MGSLHKCSYKSNNERPGGMENSEIFKQWKDNANGHFKMDARIKIFMVKLVCIENFKFSILRSIFGKDLHIVRWKLMTRIDDTDLRIT